MELKYQLKQVLSPRRFLAKELRQMPRHDIRKERLKHDIKECFLTSKKFDEFEHKIKQKGYEIFKARGIACSNFM
jgi:malate/lactate dehydrogenase